MELYHCSLPNCYERLRIKYTVRFAVLDYVSGSEFEFLAIATFRHYLKHIFFQIALNALQEVFAITRYMA